MTKSPEITNGTRYRIKIVPKTNTNADGEWIEAIGPEIVEGMTNIDYLASITDRVPKTHFAVEIRRIYL